MWAGLSIVATLAALPLTSGRTAVQENLLKALQLYHDIQLLQALNELNLTKEQMEQLARILKEFHSSRIPASKQLRELVKDLETAKRYVVAGKPIPESLKKKLESYKPSLQRPALKEMREVVDKLRRVLKPEQWEKASQLGMRMLLSRLPPGLRKRMARRVPFVGAARLKQLLEGLEGIRKMKQEEFERNKGKIAEEVVKRLGIRDPARRERVRSKVVEALSRIRGMSDEEFERHKRRALRKLLWGLRHRALRQRALMRGPWHPGWPPAHHWHPPCPHHWRWAPRGPWRGRPPMGWGPAPHWRGGLAPRRVPRRAWGRILPKLLKGVAALRLLLDPRLPDLLEERLRYVR